jgi:hypothetical protein
VIRISAVPAYDTRPFDRAELRRRLDEALAHLCDEGGYTIDEGRCSVVLWIEFVAPASGARDAPGSSR